MRGARGREEDKAPQERMRGKAEGLEFPCGPGCAAGCAGACAASKAALLRNVRPAKRYTSDRAF